MRIKNVEKIHLKYSEFYERSNNNVIEHIIKIRGFKNRSYDDTKNIIRLMELVDNDKIISLFLKCIENKYIDLCIRILSDYKLDLNDFDIQVLFFCLFKKTDENKLQIDYLIDHGFKPYFENYENGLVTCNRLEWYEKYKNNFNDYCIDRILGK